MATRLDSYFLPGKSVAVSDFFAFVSGRHCSGLALRPRIGPGNSPRQPRLHRASKHPSEKSGLPTRKENPARGASEEFWLGVKGRRLSAPSPFSNRSSNSLQINHGNNATTAYLSGCIPLETSPGPAIREALVSDPGAFPHQGHFREPRTAEPRRYGRSTGPTGVQGSSAGPRQPIPESGSCRCR